MNAIMKIIAASLLLLPVGTRAEETACKEPRRPILAFRSNLLMPLLNIGVECPIGDRWSAAADFYYPWCPREWMNGWTSPQMTCIQGLGLYVEGRYWFAARQRLLGHSVGLLAGGAYYDMELDGNGGQGEILAAGLDYTYTLPLGRKGGVRLEFSIAVGAVYSIRHPYNVHEEGGYLIRRKDGDNISIVSQSNWSFLPIRAGINLSVPISAAKYGK